MAKRTWSDLTQLQRGAILAGGALETAITAAAVRDLLRRPSGEFRGSKPAWLLACFVQPFGPIAYFVASRR